MSFLVLPFRLLRALRRAKVPIPLLTRLSAPLDDLLTVLFQQVAAGMVVVDRSGHIVRVNDALGAMARNGVDLQPGRTVAGLFSPGKRDEAWAELTPVLAGRRQPRPFVSAMPAPDGLELTVEVVSTVLREADGAVGGLVLRLADITVQRQLEAQLVQGQKLQALGQLAGGIAHDFNNLLTAILGAADEQLLRPDALDAEAVADMLQIRRSAERGAALVRQLLAFGRQQTLQPRVVALDEVVEGLADLLHRLLGGRVDLSLDLEKPAARVRVDPTQLEQVLVNLAVNARDAMVDGGTLTLHSGHITLFRALVRGAETVPPGRYAMLEVRDTGSGIRPEVLPRIFDPFFTTKRDGGGHGLGLSTVHGIIRQSGGFLGVDSTPGHGTAFRIYLPREDDDAPITIPHPPAPEGVRAGTARPEAPGAGRRVLFVDDEHAVLELGSQALTRRGWTVLTASCGEDAVGLVPTGSEVDIVVSDVVMPGMDGPSLVRQLRARNAGLPAILASGYAEEALRGDLADVGVEFIGKPYSLKQLVTLMETVLAKQAALDGGN